MSEKILKTPLFKLIVFIFIACFCVILGKFFKFDIEQIRLILSQYPIGIAGLVFILMYVGSTTLIWFGPKDILRVAGALFFGGAVSSVFVYIGELCNGIILFSISRKLGRDYVEKKFRIKQQHVKKASGDAGFWGVMALKINLMFPLRVCDLGYGLTKISIMKFIGASTLVIFPRVYLVQMMIDKLGVSMIENPPKDLLDSLHLVTGFMADNPGFVKVIFVYVGLVAVLSVIAWSIKMVRKAKSAKSLSLDSKGEI